MKKYLFLIILLIIYIVLITGKKTEKVLSYNDLGNENVSEFNLVFKNGINSNNLSVLFNQYEGEYLIKNISLNETKADVKSNNITDCIKQVFSSENNAFSEIYMASGFKVNELSLLAYNDEIIPFLEENNIYYYIK